jgi:hypothetical protein
MLMYSISLFSVSKNAPISSLCSPEKWSFAKSKLPLFKSSQASNLNLSYLTLRLRFFANYSRIEFYTTNSYVGKCAAGFGKKERYTVFSGGIAKAF